MRHYKARQLEGGGWKYTYMLNGEVFTTGKCIDHEGHATAEEACECYRQYMLNERMQLSDCLLGETTMEQCHVEGCKEMGRGGAMVAQRLFILCDAHRNRETMDELYPAVGEAWVS